MPLWRRNPEIGEYLFRKIGKRGIILAEMRGHNGDRRESVPFPRSLQHGHLCPLHDAYNVCLQYITAFKEDT